MPQGGNHVENPAKFVHTQWRKQAQWLGVPQGMSIKYSSLSLVIQPTVSTTGHVPNQTVTIFPTVNMWG